MNPWIESEPLGGVRRLLVFSRAFDFHRPRRMRAGLYEDIETASIFKQPAARDRPYDQGVMAPAGKSAVRPARSVISKRSPRAALPDIVIGVTVLDLHCLCEIGTEFDRNC